MRSALTIFLILIIAAAIVAVFRFGVGAGEDTWLCLDGAWVKHGNPSAPMPSASCVPSPLPDGGRACTAEAKLCPDGSAVGRTGPNCEFAPCP